MKKTKVISRSNLPSRPPITLTGVVILFLDRFNAPGWTCAAMLIVGIIVWCLYFAGTKTEDPIDILNKD